MAKPMRIISLNLGSQTIGLAEFQAKAEGGLVLQNYRLREVLIDPVGEGIRHTQISATLREMMAELQIRHEVVNYAVPAQSVFARFVKLPAVEEEKIERIIAFEAQQNVPFPIDEVVWDYQLIGGGGDEQVQVVLVAIKADLVDEINARSKKQGCARRLSVLPPWRFTTPFVITTPTSAAARCSSISGRARPIWFSSSRRKFSRAAFRLEGVQSRQPLPKNSMSRLRRQNFARSATALSVLAAPMRSRRTPRSPP